MTIAVRNARQHFGLLLPCNVVVHEAENANGTATRVDIADPVAMLGIVQNSEMQSLATEARTRLEAVVASLSTAN